MSDSIKFRLREGFTRFAAEGHGVVLEAKDVFETADVELAKLLDRAPALERVDTPEADKPAESEVTA